MEDGNERPYHRLRRPLARSGATCLTVQVFALAMPVDVSGGFTLTAHEARELTHRLAGRPPGPYVARSRALFADTEAA